MSAYNETGNSGREENSRPATSGSTPPVYTIYPESAQGNVNYGFHASHPLAPPPTYEDVISGKPVGQPSYYSPPAPGLYQHESIPGRVILVPDPAYKYSKLHRGIGLAFMVIFFIAFITISVKIFSSMRI